VNGGRFHSLDDARSATSAWFVKLAKRGLGTADQWLAAGATVSVPGGVMLPEAILVLDALVVRHDINPRTLLVGEIKTYPDRGGSQIHQNWRPHALRLACMCMASNSSWMSCTSSNTSQ
jgi:hypothetical protein